MQKYNKIKQNRLHLIIFFSRALFFNWSRDHQNTCIVDQDLRFFFKPVRQVGRYLIASSHMALRSKSLPIPILFYPITILTYEFL